MLWDPNQQVGEVSQLKTCMVQAGSSRHHRGLAGLSRYHLKLRLFGEGVLSRKLAVSKQP